MGVSEQSVGRAHQWLSHDNDNLERVSRILEALDAARHIGDADWDAAYYQMQRWIRDTRPPSDVILSIEHLEELHQKDSRDAATTVRSSRLRRIVQEDVTKRQRAVDISVRRLRSTNESVDSPAAAQAQWDVFVSYAHEDEDLAGEIAERLEKKQLTVFRSASSIVPGEVWQESIRRALLGAKVAVLLLTPHSQSADWVMAEIGACWVLEVPIIPALSHVKLDSMPGFISRNQGIAIKTVAQRDQLIALVLATVARRRGA